MMTSIYDDEYLNVNCEGSTYGSLISMLVHTGEPLAVYLVVAHRKKKGGKKTRFSREKVEIASGALQLASAVPRSR